MEYIVAIPMPYRNILVLGTIIIMSIVVTRIIFAIMARLDDIV